MSSGRSASVGKCFQQAFNQPSGIDVAALPLTTHHPQHPRRLLALIKTTHSAIDDKWQTMWLWGSKRGWERGKGSWCLMGSTWWHVACKSKDVAVRTKYEYVICLGNCPNLNRYTHFGTRRARSCLTSQQVGHRCHRKQVNTLTAETARLWVTLQNRLYRASHISHILTFVTAIYPIWHLRGV